MKSIITTIGVCVLLTGATRIIAQEQKEKDQQPAAKSEETIIAKASVQKVDKEKREVTFKKADGTMVTIKAPNTVRNFDQIKPGDIATVKYTESIAVSVRKSNEPPSATGKESISRAPLGERPAAQRTATIQINATIEKIDKEKRELTLMGPQGNTKTVKVSEDVKRFNELKVGDQVVINATETVSIEVNEPGK